MTPLVYSTFILGMALLFGSAIVSLSYLGLSTNPRLLNLSFRGSVASLAVLVIMMAVRTAQWGQVPFTTVADSLTLFVTCGLAILVVQLAAAPPHRALLCFYLPPLALIGALSTFRAHPTFSEAPKPLSDTLLTVHVGLVFLAFALFFLAGLNSVAYAFQAQRLKHRKTTGLFQKLPSLEALDTYLFQLIRIGYLTFAVTLVVGGFWVWYEGNQLSGTWWLSPKIVMATAMLFFYAFSYHARAAGRLRGPKLAHLVCYGTGALIGLYLFLAMFDVLNYNFYGDAG